MEKRDWKASSAVFSICFAYFNIFYFTSEWVVTSCLVPRCPLAVTLLYSTQAERR